LKNKNNNGNIESSSPAWFESEEGGGRGQVRTFLSTSTDLPGTNTSTCTSSI
jgi:hypothetical protein